MKPIITHEQTITIPAETAAQAVSIAADVAALTAVQAQAKAARETVRAAMMEDPDWQAARELKKQIKQSTAGTREEIKALETAARERQAPMRADALIQRGCRREGYATQSHARSARSVSSCSRSIARTAMNEPVTLAEWIARIEAIENVAMRNQVGCVIYWRYFSGMPASERVTQFDKYLREWSPKDYPDDDDLMDQLIELGVHPLNAKTWSRTPKMATDDERLRHMQKQRDRRKGSRQQVIKCAT